MSDIEAWIFALEADFALSIHSRRDIAAALRALQERNRMLEAELDTSREMSTALVIERDQFAAALKSLGTP